MSILKVQEIQHTNGTSASISTQAVMCWWDRQAATAYDGARLKPSGNSRNGRWRCHCCANRRTSDGTTAQFRKDNAQSARLLFYREIILP